MFMEVKSQQVKPKHEARGWQLIVKLFWSVANVFGWASAQIKWE
jgi:hypothetical protein